MIDSVRSWLRHHTELLRETTGRWVREYLIRPLERNQTVQTLWRGTCEMGAYANASRLPFPLRDRVVSFLSSYVYTDDISATALVRVTFDVDAVFWQRYAPLEIEGRISYGYERQRLLHLAITGGDVDLVRDLLAYGATVNFSIYTDRCTPYVCHVVSETNIPFEARREVLQLLLGRGAEVNGFSQNGRKPLCLLLQNSSLSEEERIELAGILLQRGVPIQEHGFPNMRLHEALIGRNYRIALFLLENGFNPNTIRLPGGGANMLPIHDMLYQEDLDLRALNFLAQLLRYGSSRNYDANNIIGTMYAPITPLSLTFSRGHWIALPLLLQHGARPTEKQEKESYIRFPEIIATFFNAHPELLQDIGQANRACVEEFAAARELPFEEAASAFVELTPEEKLQYQGPLLRHVVALYENNAEFSALLNKVTELYAENAEFAAFLNPLLHLISLMRHSQDLGTTTAPWFQAEGVDDMGLLTSRAVAQAVYQFIRAPMDRIPSDLLQYRLICHLLPHSQLTPALPSDFMSRFYPQVAPQLSRRDKASIEEIEL